jgi:hypothetical protein
MAEDEPEFTTAGELRSTEPEGASGDADGEDQGSTPPGQTGSTFAIPDRPERSYPRHGGVEYRGGTVFRLVPDRDRETAPVASVVESVLDGHEYRYGDWFDLPMPLYLVHDDGTNDTFRVAVRDGTVELHVRPETSPAGLQALYERLAAATACGWEVERRT